MKKCLWLILIFFVFLLGYKAFADEVEQKTDSSFVGEDTEKPINSSFVGDVSNSVVNESADNTYFAGDNSDKEEQNETDAPFAGDGTFVGNNYGK